MSKNKLTIFHICRKDGSSIFIYPFNKKQNIIELIDNNEITGLYGKEPRVESMTMLRNELYRMIEQSVKDWISERKFIPRFLISTGVFLLLYFVMSFVIRDPIPMIDEIIIGIAGAIVTYIILTKRDTDSKASTEMKVKLRNKVDSIVFNEDRFINDVEQYLQYCETSDDMNQLLNNITDDKSNIIFDDSDKSKLQEIKLGIKLMFDDKEIKKHEKLLRRISENDKYPAGRSKMLRWMSSRNVDPFLFAVYAKIKIEK